MDEEIIDPLDAIPAIREYDCPECGDHLTQQAVQQGSIPLTADRSERGVGRYVVYTCPNHGNYRISRDEDPGDKCTATVTVYESGIVNVDGDLEDRQDDLKVYLDTEINSSITLDELKDSLRM